MNKRRTVAAFTSVCVIAFSSVAVAAERVENAAAGISLVPPAGWHAASLEQIQANRERVRLSDPELQRALETRSALPVFAFTKYAEPYPALNPAVQITMRPAMAGSATHLLSSAVEAMRRGFADIQIVAPARPAKVSGLNGAHMMVAYTLKNSAGDSFRVLSRLWLVPRGRLMFLIGMSGTEAGTDVCEGEFAAALASIDIQK
jgi:hypothetical protein